jgi:hypothetical protein
MCMACLETIVERFHLAVSPTRTPSVALALETSLVEWES